MKHTLTLTAQLKHRSFQALAGYEPPQLKQHNFSVLSTRVVHE